MTREPQLPADIDARIGSLGKALEAAPGIVFAWLFGSAARGELRQQSDVDVAVFLDDDVDPVEGRLDAIVRVSRHLGTDSVDVVVLNSVPTSLLARILRDRRVLLDREPFRRHRFESLAIRQAADFRIFEHRLLERRTRRG